MCGWWFNWHCNTLNLIYAWNVFGLSIMLVAVIYRCIRITPTQFKAVDWLESYTQELICYNIIQMKLYVLLFYETT